MSLRLTPAGKLVDAGAVDGAADADQARPAVLLHAEGGERLPAVGDDPGDVRDGLHVVHDRRQPEGPHRRREGGLEPRPSALPLEGVDQGGLLPADVGPRAAVDRHVEVEPRPEDVLPEEPRRVRLGDRLVHDPRLADELAPDVDPAGVGPQGEAGDDDPLDQEVRSAGHDDPVLEGPRLPLVRVDDQHAGAGEILREEPPLDPRREPGAAAAAKVRLLHLVDDLPRGPSRRLSSTRRSRRTAGTCPSGGTARWRNAW